MEQTGTHPVEGASDGIDWSVLVEPAVDEFGRDDFFTDQELAFATQRAITGHTDVLSESFPLSLTDEQPLVMDEQFEPLLAEQAPSDALMPSLSRVPEDYAQLAVSPVGQALATLKTMGHEAQVMATSQSLELTNHYAEAGRVVTVDLDEATGAIPVVSEADMSAHAAREQAGLLDFSEDAEAQMLLSADNDALLRGQEAPTRLALQDATVALAGLRQALDGARANPETDTAAEELTLRNAARWVTEHTVARPADVLSIAQWYNFADEAVEAEATVVPDTAPQTAAA